MTITSNDLNDVGQCEMYMVLKSDGYTHDADGTTRSLPDHKYQFTATVDPCQTTLSNDPPLNAMVYFLADETLTTQTYTMAQDNACGYTETVTLEPSYSWISVDPNTNTISIDYLDSTNSALIGGYIMTLKKSICIPDDYTEATCTTVEIAVDFDVSLLQGDTFYVCKDYSNWFYVDDGS